MKEQTKKILKGVFFFVSWVVDVVRYFKKKKDSESNENEFIDNNKKK